MENDTWYERIQAVRRQRLGQLIREQFENSQAKFVNKTGENQGEVSALLKFKSFGERKARKIEDSCGIGKYWLDGDMGPINAGPQAREVARAFDTLNQAQQEFVVNLISSYGVKVERIAEEKPLRIEQRPGVATSKEYSHGEKKSFGSG